MGGEKELASYYEHRFRKCGMKVVRQEVEPERFNVIGILEGKGVKGASLMYNGHMDTAWAGDEEGIDELGPGFKPKSFVKGDWIYGVGAYNMKSGFTSAVAAVEAIVEAGVSFRGDLILAAVVGETCHTQVGRYQGARYRGAGVGTNFMVNNGVVADMAIIPEPTEGKIAIASGGYVYMQIRTLGNPGATYKLGNLGGKVKPAVDAIEKMYTVIEALKKWAPKYEARHKKMGEEATNIAIIAIEGGHPWRPSKNAPYCRLYLEVDTVVGQLPLEVICEVKEILDGLKKRDQSLLLRWTSFKPHRAHRCRKMSI